MLGGQFYSQYWNACLGAWAAPVIGDAGRHFRWLRDGQSEFEEISQNFAMLGMELQQGPTGGWPQAGSERPATTPHQADRQPVGHTADF